MTVTAEVHDFPTIPIEKQLFYAPGLTSVGGFTVGGVRLTTNEPGGFGFLDIQPALQVNEWDYPETSWLMSQTNGQILRVRLAPTPQIAGAQAIRRGVAWDNDARWANQQYWSGDMNITYAADAQSGTTTVQVDLSDYGGMLKRGHVIGHKFSTYMINKVTQIDASTYELTISPPLRSDVVTGDTAYNRPYFTGQISNATEVRQAYEAGNNGAIQMPSITLAEVIL